MRKKIHVKTGDTVMVISGKDKGKTGKVLEVSPKEGKVIVEDLNIVTKHVKPRREGEAGGIMKVPVPCTPPRSCSTAPSARKPPALPTRSRATARCVSASTAAQSCKEREDRNTWHA